MRDILASIRYMLAYVDLEKMNIGIIAQTFIRNDVIPALRKKLEMVRTEEEEKELTELIEAYSLYSDPRSQEGKIYTKTASNIIRELANRSNLSDDEMEDLMQELAMDFLKPLVEGGKDMMDNLRQKFNIEGGPVSLNKLWSSMVAYRVKWRIRETKRLYKEKTLEMRESEEGEELDPIQQIPGQAIVDFGSVGPMLNNLDHYVKPKLRNPKFVDMFHRWLSFVKEGEKPGDIDMKNDVYKSLVKDGLLTSTYQTFADQWRDNILPEVREYFIDVMGMDPVLVRRYVGSMSVVEAVTQGEYNRRVAKWMIGGILRAQIEAGE